MYESTHPRDVENIAQLSHFLPGGTTPPPWSERGCFARIIIRFEQQEIHKIFPDFPPGGRLWHQLNSGSVETEKVLSANLEMVVLFAVMFRGLGVVKNRNRVGAQANRQLS